MAKNNILKVEGISVSYGQVRALRHVSLEVNQGEIVALIGANGAGKSTLVGAVLGINRVSSGTIRFMGEDITRTLTERIVASGICLIPEGRGILPLMTVLENLQLGAYHLKADINQYLERAYHRFPVLGERSKQIAGTMSGGEQQMLSVGRGLMSAPKLIMLDEPSLGLSPVLVVELFKTIVNLNREGYTILLSEQNAHKALGCAHRGYVFETGTIVLSGTAQELASNPRVRQAYLGG
ncbi:High-affinity branched-chain amino acid transport ATP-binding protein LivF [subsurface metagenome]